MRGSRTLGIYLPRETPRYTEKEVISVKAACRVLKPRQNSRGVEGAKESRRVEVRLSVHKTVCPRLAPSLCVEAYRAVRRPL